MIEVRNLSKRYGDKLSRLTAWTSWCSRGS
jgi:hypothetical protein